MSIDLILLKVWALLRPVTMVDVDIRIMGLGFFELVGIGFIGLLGLAILFRASREHRLEITGIDIVVLLYIFWIVAGVIAYPDKSTISEVVKLITPFLTWFAIKAIVRSEVDYVKVLQLASIGFAVILIANACAIVVLPETITVAKTPWNTKLPIYQGLYDNAGTLGLSVSTLVLVYGIHRALRKNYIGEEGVIPLGIKTALISFLVSGAALFCLVKSQSRTAMLGIVIFYGIFYARKSKYLLVLAGVVAIFLALLEPSWKLIFNDFVRVYSGELDIAAIGSGRPRIWMHNLLEFNKLPLERQIIGAGVGNTVPIFTWAGAGNDSIWSSHNDYLYLLMHTGFVGFVIYLVFQLAILKKILEFKSSESWVFLAAFIAVLIMNISTNAYISRYPLAQMYLLIFVFMDMKQRSQGSSEIYDSAYDTLRVRENRSHL